eukprot:c12595_g1_i3.p1 GENE.c12595_g1_i3~~c12595_g1_i3.p1  ORF type:complete len:169 (-),score=26.85 c12595_g1_i3:21-527(-)
MHAVVAGVLFGVWFGSAAFMLGAMLGAIASFLAARRVLKKWAQTKIAESPTLTALDRALERDRSIALKVVILSRLSPIFPFPLLSYVFGATNVSLKDFTLGTAFGLAPGVVLYSYLGITMREASSSKSNLLPLVITVVSIFLTSWQAQRILKQITNSGTDSPAPKQKE